MQKTVVNPANLIIGESANEIEMLLGIATGTIFMEAEEDEVEIEEGEFDEEDESDDEESEDEESNDEESDDEAT